MAKHYLYCFAEGFERFLGVCKGSKSPGAGGAGRKGRGWAGEVEARKVAPRKILCLARGAKLFVSVCPEEWATIDRVNFVCAVIDFISCCEG